MGDKLEIKLKKNVPREVLESLCNDENGLGEIKLVLSDKYNVFEIERAQQRYMKNECTDYGKFLADEIVRKNIKHYILKCDKANSKEVMKEINDYIEI